MRIADSIFFRSYVFVNVSSISNFFAMLYNAAYFGIRNFLVSVTSNPSRAVYVLLNHRILLHFDILYFSWTKRPVDVHPKTSRRGENKGAEIQCTEGKGKIWCYHANLTTWSRNHSLITKSFSGFIKCKDYFRNV